MNISTLIDSLTKTLPRHRRPYEQARARHPSLAPYATPQATHAALEGLSEDDGDPRAALVVALLEEHRRTASPVWQTLLFLAFKPMLRTLRTRFGRKPDDDLDQEVLSAFAASLGSDALDRTRLVLSLRLATEKAVREARLRRGAATVSFNEEVHGSVDPHADPAPADRLAAGLAGALATSELDQDAAADLLGTLAGDESLRDYVNRVHAALGDLERRAAYERLVKARARLVEHVRTELRAAVATKAA